MNALKWTTGVLAGFLLSDATFVLALLPMIFATPLLIIPLLAGLNPAAVWLR